MSKKNKLQKLFRIKNIKKIFKPKKKNRYKLFWILLLIIFIDVILYSVLTIKYSTRLINNNKTITIKDTLNTNANTSSKSITKVNKLDKTTKVIDNTNESNLSKEEIKATIKKENKVLLDNTQDYILNFYNYINNKDYIWLLSIFDRPFKKDTTIKTYFSEKRLNNFVDSLDWSLEIKEVLEVTQGRKNTEYIIRKSYKYLLKYKINNIEFKENWKIVLVSRDWGDNFLVNSLFCESKGCSKSPFYK